MGSDFGNSEQNLCGANSVNNQLIFNGTNGNLNNNNRYNNNRVRVALEFDHNEASPKSCVPSSAWWIYYLIARKQKKNKAAHLSFRLHCFDNLSAIKSNVNNMEYLPSKSQAFVITVPNVREVTIKKGYRKSDYYKHIAKRRKIEIFKPLKLQAA